MTGASRFGDRPISTVARSIGERRHYVALLNIARRFREPAAVLRRYVHGGGAYPWTAGVRTPIGPVEAKLFHPHDVRTLVEVFARLDYRVAPDTSVAVDIGANIGLSALYFLTRNESVFCYSFEPDPRNVRKLNENLHAHAGRLVVHECAVLDRSGVFEFGIEPSGRYGGIGRELPDSIAVHARDVNSVLREILAEHDRVDVLKIDTEGTERRTVAAIEPELAARIDVIYLEDETLEHELHPGRFRQSRRGHCVRLERRGDAV